MKEASQLPQPSIVDLDPEDLSQLLDEAGQFSVLEVEAQPSAEAEADLDAAEAEASEVDEDAAELDTPAETTADAYERAAKKDTGDLYGVRTPHASDRDLAEATDSPQGEHFFESLEKHAAESGAEPEEELVVLDDSDEHRGHNSTDHRDRPVADKGSAGPGGL